MNYHKNMKSAENLSSKKAKKLDKLSEELIQDRRKWFLENFLPAKYSILVIGLAEDSFSDTPIITIDNKFAIFQRHPTYELLICPFKGQEQSYFEEINFYANCFSFELDLPTFVVWDNAYLMNYKPVYYNLNNSFMDKKEKKEFNYNFFINRYISILEDVVRLRLGFGIVHFYEEYNFERVNLDFSKNYDIVEKELQLYAGALRQIDFFVEFLQYFRIIESCIESDNRKDCIEHISHKIDKIKNFNFGSITITDFDRENKKNLFELYRERALGHIKLLKNKLNLKTNEKIAEYFYDLRCKIAHGTRKDVKKQNFYSDYFSIIEDIYVIKLLSRIFIHEKIKN